MSNGEFPVDRVETYHGLQGAQKFITMQIRHLTKMSNVATMLLGAISEGKTITLTLTTDRQQVTATIDSGGEVTLFEKIPWRSFSEWVLPVLFTPQDQPSRRKWLYKHRSARILPQ